MHPFICLCCLLAGLLFFALVWLLTERRDRKEAERRLSELQAKYFALLDQLPDPEPWQHQRRKQAAAHKAAEPVGYHYPAEGRDGQEA